MKELLIFKHNEAYKANDLTNWLFSICESFSMKKRIIVLGGKGCAYFNLFASMITEAAGKYMLSTELDELVTSL